MSVIRILIADDSGEWRDFIVYLLAKDCRFEIVAQARHGLEAIDLAKQLQPSLVLLDIRMPGVNGLEVARQILAMESSARIIFVTGEADCDIVSAALDLGASGYVLKMKASTDLRVAIESVMKGSSFVSSGLLPNTDMGEKSIQQDLDRSSSNPPSTSPKKFSCAPY
ncbi:MAG TPA: response regulator transcription factor [Dongiaceae bacterium]|nr:response regulator transcription factor [Dongiaceae bacterium]